MLNETIENSELRLTDLENNITNLKFELINSGENLRKNNKLVYLPIMRTEDKKLLAKWFGKDFELIMAYDSSKMGDSSVVFHEKCHGKIQTLTLIETENGRRFGGYTKLSWDCEGKESFKGGDISAFIFSLDQKFKLDSVDEENVIFSSTKAGPKFGKHDIVISDEFTKNCNSYSCVFNSYGKKEQYEKEVKVEKNLNASTLLAGIEFFKVIKIEVFQVIFK
jgi:hypothetical protein